MKIFKKKKKSLIIEPWIIQGYECWPCGTNWVGTSNICPKCGKEIKINENIKP